MKEKNIQINGEYGVLKLGDLEFLFDLEDIGLIRSRAWYADKGGYLTCCYYYNGHLKFSSFHRLVMHAKPGEIVDHINRKRFDNRKKNLRVCQYSENDRNRGLYSTNKSGVSGVHFDKRRSKWVAAITYNRKKIFIGRFISKDDAIDARIKMEIELFREYSPYQGSNKL